MRHMGFTSCLADPDLWMQEAEDDNRNKIWEYILLYVDDCLCISKNPALAINKLGKYFALKEVGHPPPRVGIIST